MKEEGKLKSSKELLETRKGGKSKLNLCKPSETSLEQKGMYDNLQMVVKSCVPSNLILKLIRDRLE